MNENLNAVLEKGAKELVTFIVKDEAHGVFFHEACDETEFTPVTIGMLCTILIRNYIGALPDSVQNDAMDACYKTIEALRSFPEELEMDDDEVFGSD